MTSDEPEQVLTLSLIPCHPSLLFRFLVASVATAETAELAELQPFRRRLFILRRNVVTMLAFRALQHNVIARHNSPSLKNWARPKPQAPKIYSMMSVIVPAPTVLPPSRMANRKPFSIAIGVMSVISIATLSPGITISTPSGKFATPVTSVVRK